MQWIWGNAQAQPDEYYEFLVPFEAQNGADIRLQISCDSEYALYLNGKLLSFGQYADYIDYKVFDEIDLTNSIIAGRNELSIHVWYTGVDTQTYVKKPAGLWYQLRQEGEIIAESSPETLSRPLCGYIPHREELITKQLGLTFAYDANGIPGEFSLSHPVAGLPDVLFPRPVKKLVLGDRMPMRICEMGGFEWRGGETGAQKMDQAALHPLPGRDGVYVIADMGMETAGFLEIELDGLTAPCDITIGWGEHLADGRCRTSVRNFCCAYRAKSGHNVYMNPFRRFGCRYVQLFIEAKDVDVRYVGVRPTMYPLQINDWRPEGELRRAIYDTCVRTLQLCMHEHYEDCPWREQALYTLDSRNQMLCGYHAFGEMAFPRANLELISHGLRPDGLLSLCYPAGLDYPIPAFSLVYFIQMREYLQYSGDADFLQKKYPFLQKLMRRFLDQPREHGLIENFYGKGGFWNFYEWSDGLSGRFDEQEKRMEAPLNAFLSLALQHLAAIARELGHAADADAYSTETAALNRAIVAYFYDKDAKLFASFPENPQFHVLTNALCLLCGAAEGMDKSRMLHILTDNGGDGIVPNTLSMNCFRFDALLAEDREKYAPIILREIDETYAAMLDQGATTFWETALGEADFHGAGSLCHGWSALPIHYYSTLLS